jgi:hypothetical protein
MRPLLRPLLLVASLVAPLLAAAPAAAQITDGGTTTGTFSSTDFFIGVQHQAGANRSDFDVARFFNKAHCDCSETVYVYVALTDTGFAKRATADQTGNIEFWVGSQCASNDGTRTVRCALLGSQTMASFLTEGRATIPTTARVLSTFTQATFLDGGAPTFTPNPDCSSPSGQAFDQTLFVINYDNTGAPVQLATRQVHIDLTAPPAPDSSRITVQGGDEAVVITWPKVDSSIYTDLLGYQVLCNRGGELQVFSNGTFGAAFQECAMPGTDAGVGNGDNDGGVAGLDPRFVCSGLITTTGSSARIKILQNEIVYGIAVVSIDQSGNASVPDIFYGTPIKTKSFYDVYRNDDPMHSGGASGGLCTLGSRTTARGAAAGLGIALAIGAVTFARRRRRRR